MPFYEYECTKCGVFEVMRGIMESDLEECPECGCKEIEKLVSAPHGVIMKGREMNQYNDVLRAKYWRDKNGVRHRVKQGDGHTGAGTVSKQTASPELIEARKQRDKAADKKKRTEQSYQRYVKRAKKMKRQ